MRALRTIAVGLGLSAYLLTEAGGRMAANFVQYSDSLGLGFVKAIAEPVIAATAQGAPAYLAAIPVLASLAAGLFTASVVWPFFESTVQVTVEGGSEVVSTAAGRLAGGAKSGAMPGSRLSS